MDAVPTMASITQRVSDRKSVRKLELYDRESNHASEESQPMISQEWSPEKEGQKVRLRRNPAKRGVTTGKIKRKAGLVQVLVDFGPKEQSYKLYESLELYNEAESIETLIETERFGQPLNLRQILTYEKIKGNLTNIFYSMESSNTDFYAHQFKPVVKFLDSPTGRLLIADEVGLGKTIEAIYIWKELQAREQARRLLIVCPAMLQDKWIDDIKTRFNINAEIVKASDLYKKLKNVHQDPSRHSFAYVTSLQGIRVKSWDHLKNDREKLANLLERSSFIDNLSLLDLVIIDEAHYLRNPSTANHKIARLLRDSAQHFILLTATPVQVDNDNLYQLLKLISPKDFPESTDGKSIFKQMLEANRPIIEALRSLYSNPPNLEITKDAIQQAKESPLLRDSSRLRKIEEEIQAHLESKTTVLPKERIHLSRALDRVSLFGQFMTRSRKVEVLTDRVKRKPHSLELEFSELEQQVYGYITNSIRQQSKGKKGVSALTLIARQRQMASCMVAALSAWYENPLSDASETESCYEILGGFLEQIRNLIPGKNLLELNNDNIHCPIPSKKPEFQEFITKLKEQDQKYQALKKAIKERPDDKIVLFAFFRNTLTYLKERLEGDGIKTFLIMGGMPRETSTVKGEVRKGKQDVLRAFEQCHGQAVLLSSEVGSEGIDLQFCRVLINYDLPWNPMRVEQRIGRLDRLGQKSDSISIINFSFKETIEEKILLSLYERIRIFEESIGDIEEILGNKTDKLILTLLDPELTPMERERRAEDNIMAITQKIEEQRDLEQRSFDLFAFSEFVRESIDRDRSEGRYLKPNEVERFVLDYLKNYSNTKINSSLLNGLLELTLDAQLKSELKEFCSDNQCPVATQLYDRPTLVFFEPKKLKKLGKIGQELLDVTHPLVQWIANKYRYQEDDESLESTLLYPLSKIALSLNNENLESVKFQEGIYFYIAELWKFEGLRTEQRLAYKVVCFENHRSLPSEIAEQLVNMAALHGEPLHKIPVEISILKQFYEESKSNLLDDFSDEEDLFRAENEDRCQVQKAGVEATIQQRIQDIQNRIQSYRDSHDQQRIQMIPAEEGKLKKRQLELQEALRRIERFSEPNTQNKTLSAGVIKVNK